MNKEKLFPALSWLFTSAAGKLNQGLPGSNSTSGQGGSGIFGSQGKRPNHWATLVPPASVPPHPRLSEFPSALDDEGGDENP